MLALRRANGRVGGPFFPVGAVGAQFEDDGEDVGLGVQGVDQDVVFVAAGERERRWENGEADELARCQTEEEEGGGVDPGQTRTADCGIGGGGGCRSGAGSVCQCRGRSVGLACAMRYSGGGGTEIGARLC